MVLADKYRYYVAQVRQMKRDPETERERQRNGKGNTDKIDRVTYLTATNRDKTPEGLVLDELGLTKMCCRRHLLTHVDIE
jgi:DNA-directed RNA polymerase I, II, and III subunit RPABC5